MSNVLCKQSLGSYAGNNRVCLRMAEIDTGNTSCMIPELIPGFVEECGWRTCALHIHDVV